MARYPFIAAGVAAIGMIAISSAFAQSPARRRAQSPLCARPASSYVSPCGAREAGDLRQALCAQAGATDDTACVIGLVQGGCAGDRGAQRYEVTVETDGTAVKSYVAVRAAKCGPPAQAGGDPVWRQALPANWIPSGI